MVNQKTNHQLKGQIKDMKKDLQEAENVLASETTARDRSAERPGNALNRSKVEKNKYPESEGFYKIILESISDIAYTVAPEGTITYVSPQIKQNGYSPEEMISKNFIEFVKTDQRQEVIRKFESGKASGDSLPTQFQFINQDGSHTWVEVVGKTVVDEFGNPLQQVGILRNISYQKELEEKLQRSEENYRMLVENSYDVICGIVDRKFVFCNSPISQYGYTPEDIIGQDILDFVAPEYREETYQSFQQALKAGVQKPVRFPWLNKDGSRVWVEVVGKALRSDSGKIIEEFGIMRNISHQKELEDKLRQSEERYRNLVEQINEIIYTVNLEGVITYVSPAVEHIMGYSPVEVIGQSFDKFFTSDDVPSVRDNFKIISAGRAARSQEYKILTKSGEVRWVTTSSRLVMESDQAICLNGVLTDITDRKLFEAQIEQIAANAERAHLARELHDSVTQALFTTSLIADTLPRVWEIDPGEAQKGLEQICRLSSGALAEMRVLLLELRPHTLEEQDLDFLLRQLADGLMTRTQATITTTIMGNCKLPREVRISFYRIAQEALNNIVKHSNASIAKINLNCTKEGVTLSVIDNGRGFDPDATHPEHFGLEIMRERSLAIDANIRINSRPGQGTEVVVQWKEKGSLV